MNDRLALVTGSTGFIGSQLAKHLLDRGWRVRVTLRSGSRTERLDSLACERAVVDLSSGDYECLEPALREVTHIFHVAGLVAGTPAELDRVNRQGTEWLARYASQQSDPPVFVLVSSAAAGGPSAADRPRRPSEPPAPISHYGRSKLGGELAALAYSPPLPLTIVRPGIVFGEGDREFVQLLRTMLRFRINPMVGRGHQPLSMIEVHDLCRLLILAAEHGQRVSPKDPAGRPEEGRGIYNAADPDPMSLVQLGQAVREATGLRGIVNVPLPPRAGYVVGALSETFGRWTGRRITLNRDKITEARATGWAMDVSKTTTELGWAPRQPLQAHLRDACHALS